ncbi:hypothetical protein G6F37_013349 [Rhizopus arrhizus]|nr:hypothetical protein G6F38_013288 [Rhizopus arrhizus]KAG1138342.1 hypothetical protein G6F37_013349 [Rhizopus arrhizus]
MCRFTNCSCTEVWINLVAEWETRSESKGRLSNTSCQCARQMAKRVCPIITEAGAKVERKGTRGNLSDITVFWTCSGENGQRGKYLRQTYLQTASLAGHWKMFGLVNSSLSYFEYLKHFIDPNEFLPSNLFEKLPGLAREYRVVTDFQPLDRNQVVNKQAIDGAKEKLMVLLMHSIAISQQNN